MAEKNRYPQIPSTVWWGVRSILQRTPNATIDERFLSVQLRVQEAAARAYIVELKSVGLITDEGKATPLAHKWRLDDTYAEAVEELIQTTYPEGLLHVAPPGDADRQKVVTWFLREGLGQGSAGNKAATYMLLSSPRPSDAPTRGGARSGNEDPGKRAPQPRHGARSEPKPASAARGSAARSNRSGGGRNQNHSRAEVPEAFPLNVNVQIHISADAGSEQIESIFSAMRRYLYDAPGS
jgi:Family of unknown function (DUF5343)